MARRKRQFHCQKCGLPCEIYKKGKGHRVLVCPSCGVLATNPFAQRAGGALSGAATGAALGSVVPGVGTAVGAGAGALIGALSSGGDDAAPSTTPVASCAPRRSRTPALSWVDKALRA